MYHTENLNFLQAAFENDTSPLKTDLMCGVYRTDSGGPFVMKAVKMAKEILYNDPNWNHEYPPSHLGTREFRLLSANLFFGANNTLIHQNRIASMQTLGASGACHMGAVFLERHYGPWKDLDAKAVTFNHPNVFQYLGIKAISIPYYSHRTGSINFEKFQAALESAPNQSVIVLQVAGNNPTGCDPTISQWKRLADIFQRKKFFAFFDAAYLGFVSGDPFEDSEALRIFAKANIPMLVAATYGKSFGLYGERVGILLVATSAAETTVKVEKHMKLLARAETGAMPAFGSKIVELILSNDSVRKIWEADVRSISQELNSRRRQLQMRLQELGTSGDWSFLTDQVGMFSYTGFSPTEVNSLRHLYHVYLQDTGRLSIAGLNSSNINHVAQSIDTVIRNNEYRNEG
ncbi:putative aspartate aminotransferase [Xylona heveae TC161]|uniref:Putative aspartate aminotransferase n=1 Tax=Xylona heveae (strain CBS 132557 / TC161) TaxID=1328760 RepID=A0A165FGS4_XYLHT|nr:putative aspartate aminotransferase [Xylona heveae TC161]KZF20960.1 putative aspartate aminotransferase [Xylona heveae TC161]